MFKRFVLAAGIYLFFPSVTSYAMMVTGEVLSVDKDKQQVILQVKAPDKQPQTVTVRTNTPLPACAEPGITMRAWGSYEDKNNFFSATDLRGPGYWSDHDPTGVHLRLRRHKAHGKRLHRRRKHRRKH